MSVINPSGVVLTLSTFNDSNVERSWGTEGWLQERNEGKEAEREETFPHGGGISPLGQGCHWLYGAVWSDEGSSCV